MKANIQPPLPRSEIIRRIRAIMPSYDALPDLVDPAAAADFTKIKPATLATQRSRRDTMDIGFIKCGTRVMYPKIELAKFMISRSHGIDFAP